MSQLAANPARRSCAVVVATIVLFLIGVYYLYLFIDALKSNFTLAVVWLALIASTLMLSAIGLLTARWWTVYVFLVPLTSIITRGVFTLFIFLFPPEHLNLGDILGAVQAMLTLGVFTVIMLLILWLLLRLAQQRRLTTNPIARSGSVWMSAFAIAIPLMLSLILFVPPLQTGLALRQTADATATAVQAQYQVERNATTTAKPAADAAAFATLQTKATAAANAAQTATPVVSTDTWRVVFADSFEPGDANVWSRGSFSFMNETTTLSFVGGKYRVKYGEYVPENTSYSPGNGYILNVSDFAVSVVAQRVGGLDDCGYGVLLHTHYVFLVRDNQEWVYGLDGQVTPLLTGISSAIHPNQPNRIRVVGNGSTFTFFVNDQWIGEGTENEGRGGVYLFTDTRQKGICVVDFDDFELRAPP